eukprot:CAMPEP_0181351510 /NCGR_PEP_ID=MMETSP1106-20121128/1826_1 /TAXON_ID=81844 /ORGANISM="Mantoniella antarctica, Strain SL-175" /LENGTH=63 /DNA_ID=CAMNT_0023464031 /DNA_START=376 /DNA_END=567 /DNA_ORIENTATION=-
MSPTKGPAVAAAGAAATPTVSAAASSAALVTALVAELDDGGLEGGSCSRISVSSSPNACKQKN